MSIVPCLLLSVIFLNVGSVNVKVPGNRWLRSSQATAIFKSVLQFNDNIVTPPSKCFANIFFVFSN